MTEYVKKDNIAYITLKNPPVNALSLNVRNSLMKHIDEAVFDKAVKAIVIKGGGKTFCAGADITEFKTGVVFQNFIAFVINDVELCGKPVFALIHGNAFGGGFELALGCHFRIASSRSSFSLPEVKIGILPGGGGSQRLPRLIGFLHAAEIICAGSLVKAADGLSKGFVDLVVSIPPEIPPSREVEYLEQKALPFILKHMNDKLDDRIASKKPFEGLNEFFYSQVSQKLKRSARGMLAPKVAFQLMKDSVELSFDEGLELEQKELARLIRGEQAAALQHVFFSERAASKLNIRPAIKPQSVKNVGVVGAGTMGTGIAINLVKAGLSVVLIERKQESLDRGMALIKASFAKLVKKGRMPKEKAYGLVGLIKPSVRFEDLGDVDLVIEAVFEDMSVKKTVLARLDSVCKREAILCTNTSTLDIDEIASATKRPDKVIGMHFFAPANVMRLLENVRGEKTSEETIVTVTRLSKRIRKIPVLVRNCFGFVANRMLLAYMNQAFSLLNEGALPAQVDKVLYDYGFAMGPFRVADLSGVDIIYHIKRSASEAYKNGLKGGAAGTPSQEKVFAMADKLFEMKRLGLKTRRGFYTYGGRRNKAQADPEVERMAKEISASQKLKRREISKEEIIERCLFATINEGFKCLEDDTVQKPSDIDVVWIFGFGFPPYLGGPMYQANVLGLSKVAETVKKWSKAHPENPYWHPSELLLRLSKKGENMPRWVPGVVKSKM